MKPFFFICNCKIEFPFQKLLYKSNLNLELCGCKKRDERYAKQDLNKNASKKWLKIIDSVKCDQSYSLLKAKKSLKTAAFATQTNYKARFSQSDEL